ncbi:shikimate dehydrogenase [Marinovum sp.]|uniref:shikimate dehydrogenase n=1 Tax=Marinovum sp. TaxID=2024839 RepID=UPI003A92A0C2
MTENVPLAGVIGHPIHQSKSPQMHGHWLRRYGIRGHYVPMDVKPADLAEVIRALPRMGFVGANVTLPHKINVLDLVDSVTDRATIIGAANTLIVRRDGTIMADNTDGYGFIENLRQNAPGWDPKAGPAVVFGAGGACRAVISSLLETGVEKVLLSNRTRIKAEQLQHEFGMRVQVVDWVQVGNVLEDAGLVVNTTSLGMVGQPELRVPLDGLRPGTLVTDLVYSPLRTPLLEVAAERGCPTVDGLGMLLHQGVPGFERWFGRRPEVDDELRQAVLG